METDRSSEQSNIRRLDAKEGQKVILNIREAHDKDIFYAKSIGFVINGDIKKIMTNNLQKSCKDYLQIDCMGAETVLDKFNPIDDFIIGRGIKNNSEPKNISTEPTLSIFRVNCKQKADERHPNRSENMINDSFLAPRLAQQDNNRIEQQVSDDRLNDPRIVIKRPKNKKEQFEKVFLSTSESNQSIMQDKSKFIMVSNKNLVENSTPKPKNERKKSTVAKKVTKNV